VCINSKLGVKLMKAKLILLALISPALLSYSTTTGQEKPPANASQTGGGARAAEPTFRVVRTVSGTKVLEQGGRYAVEDPRTVFYAPADKQIIVYFTWEGPAGPHHFEGLWKNPDGKVAMTSDFDYKPDQPRFGGYFKMLLGDAPATGVWTLEARIDGETAGTHTFQITIAPRPDNASTTISRRLLSPPEIYNRAAAASVLIENINQKAARRNIGTGFFIGRGRLLTAFQVIDGAAKVRVVNPQGNFIDVKEIVAWNRRQDWVILNIALDSIDRLATLERAPANSWAIGDRCYFLDVPAEGNRVLVETSLIGKQTLGVAGDRLNIGDTPNRRAAGSPVLNEFGEVIGLVGAGLIPGAAFLEDMAFAARTNALGSPSRGALVVPISLVDDSSASSGTIEALASSGQFIPPLVGSQSVLNGVLARALNRKTDPPQLIDEKWEFSRADNRGVLLVTWLPKEKRKGMPALRLYDLDNHLLNEALNKKKITVNPNKLSYSSWDLTFGNLQTGIYRLDVLLEGDVVWRTFFRMVE
jgi:S1-C subfamily serine protease